MASRPAAQLGSWLALAIAVVGLVILALQAASWLTSDPAPDVVTVASAEGQVLLRQAGAERAASPGDVLGIRETITTGPLGEALLTAGGATEVRVGPGTTVQVVAADDEKVSLELEQGRLVAEVPAGGRGVRVGNAGRTISTSDGAVAVAVDEGVFSFEVRRGEAQVEGVEGVDLARAPASVSAFPDGAVHLGEIPDSLLLDVDWPEPRTRDAVATVRGRTQPGARVTVAVKDRQFFGRAGADGAFVVVVELVEGATPVVTRVEDGFGRTVEQAVTVELDTRPPVISVGQGP